MEKLYCPECGNYLEGGDGSMVDCHCGWKQERSLSSDEDEIEQLRQRVAELEGERDEEIARNRPLRNLIASLEEQKSHWNKQRDEYREAVSTMDSERSANAKLTAERDALMAALEFARQGYQAASENGDPDEVEWAEMYLRSIDTAIASVKEKA